MHVKPNFFIVGPPKCASTSLYYYLNQHPEIYLASKRKETRFFDLEYRKGIEFYEREYFSEVGNQTVVGEATATYSFLPFVADRIRKHYPDAKFIFCRRNPVDRAFSEWLMRRNMGTEELPFLKALEENAAQAPLDLTGEKGAASWEERYRIIDNQKIQKFRVYIESGIYDQHIEKYLSVFSQNQIFVIDFSDFSRNARKVLKDIFGFLGVDEHFEIPDLKIRNPYNAKKRYFRRVFNVIGHANEARLKKLLPQSIKNKVIGKLNQTGKKPKLSDEDRARAERIW